MQLARNKNGQIGRQVPGQGLQAKVAKINMGERRGDLYLSTSQVEADQAYWKQKEEETNALNQAKLMQSVAKRKADFIRLQIANQKTNAFQAVAKHDPMMEKLRAHYAKTGAMGETEAVAGSILANPPDFSSQGGNPEIIMSDYDKRPIAWRSDFRQHLIVGNPLTRDGVYGPGVTDYDRIVNGIDVNQTNIVEGATMGREHIVGGTMLGRLDGRNVKMPTNMGFDFSWGGITDWASNIADQTVDSLSDKLPDQIAKELQGIIAGGGDAHVNPATGQIIVTRPPTVVGGAAASLGIPPWALYSGLGLMGIGVLFMVIKAVKS